MVSRRRDIAGGLRSFAAPLVIGLAIWAGSPTQTAYQDMASLVSGVERTGARWGAFVEKSALGSVHQAEMPFLDATPTGSIAGGGLSTPGVGTVALRGKAAASDTPDEARVNRSDKRGRVVNVAPVAPPRSFNAGSVFERTSSLLDPASDVGVEMSFVVPEIQGKEIQIAGAFHLMEDKSEPGVPAFLASLVTNEKADILATAYAPAEPDYARASPFASLLKHEVAGAGRFIPPVPEGDHPWMRTPLPASVFSSAEQKCLAEGIYFEARGEDVLGQSAVAQVILNRVRNPAYPSTICGVVYQNKSWRNRCQFSFACDGTRPRVRSAQHYKVAQEVAMAVTAGKIFIPEVGSATHYHATYVHPRWARTMEKMKKIGLHVFYRTYGGGWR
ncbi:cell wall hydrolase [Mesorhizobium sp. CAU 1741]|uniref:cell wall hydrolase n=1 Tax=Mesorhizobium sp. CAU 1741 TaxID=3140366 RepID=UPI00325A93B2